MDPALPEGALPEGASQAFENWLTEWLERQSDIPEMLQALEAVAQLDHELGATAQSIVAQNGSWATFEAFLGALESAYIAYNITSAQFHATALLTQLQDIVNSGIMKDPGNAIARGICDILERFFIAIDLRIPSAYVELNRKIVESWQNLPNAEQELKKYSPWNFHELNKLVNAPLTMVGHPFATHLVLAGHIQSAIGAKIYLLQKEQGELERKIPVIKKRKTDLEAGVDLHTGWEAMEEKLDATAPPSLKGTPTTSVNITEEKELLQSITSAQQASETLTNLGDQLFSIEQQLGQHQGPYALITQFIDAVNLVAQQYPTLVALYEGVSPPAGYENSDDSSWSSGQDSSSASSD